MKKRLFVCAALIFALASVTVSRLILISLRSGTELGAAAAAQRAPSVICYTSRAVITDRNGVFLTDSETAYIGVTDPFVYAGGADTEQKYADYIDERKAERSVAAVPLLSEKSADGLFVFETPVRYSQNQPAVHLIGSLGPDGSGVSGLEYAFDGFLRKNEKETRISWSSGANGFFIPGDGVNLYGDGAVSNDRLILTVDIDIQRIAEKAAKTVEKGAVVVADVSTGEIAAMVSLPDYHPYDMETALATEGALTNKCLMAFNAGSAFKLVTLCAFLENGGTDFSYFCSGKKTVGENTISCHRGTAHGELDIPSALAASCNGFFISMGLATGAKQLIETAKAFGFGKSTPLAEGYSPSAGNLPTESEAENPAEIANFSMGQGRLLVTPIQLTQLCQTLANGGVKKPLYVVKGQLSDGLFTPDAASERPSVRIVSEKTAAYVSQCMVGVAENGTGRAARPDCGAGVKTSTAETGMTDKNGEKVFQSWITGFVPAENPKWVITVLSEDADLSRATASPVFLEIAEALT